MEIEHPDIERLSKLPMWVQFYIRRLRTEIEDGEVEVATHRQTLTADGEPDTFWVPRTGRRIPLGRGETIEARVGPDVVEIAVVDHGVPTIELRNRVMGRTTGLAVWPRSSNVILVRPLDPS